MKSKSIILFIVFSLFVTLACSSDDNNGNNESQIPLVKKIYKNGKVHVSYEYEDGRFKKTTYPNGNTYYLWDYSNSNETIRYRYDFSDKMTEYSKYIKVDTNTSRIEYYLVDGTLLKYRIHKFNADGCGSDEINYYKPVDSLYWKIKLKYKSSNCNSESIAYNGNGKITDYWENIKDNKKNPFYKSYLHLNYFNLNEARNTTKYLYKNSYGEIRKNLSYNSTFKYNLNDYPTKEIRTYLNGKVDVYEYEYY